MMTTTDAVIIPIDSLGGILQVPGDKSISHRLAMLASLAQGRSAISNFLLSEDCLSTLNVLQALGVKIEWEQEKLLITGSEWLPPAGDLNFANSGTGMRLMAGLLASRPWKTVLTGDASLRSRPMKRIKEPLESMGASLELSGPAGCAPLTLRGAGLQGINYRLPVASAQVKSCVLLAGLFADGNTTVWEPLPTRDHTEIILRSMGVELEVEDLRIAVKGYGSKGPDLPACDWFVPGDFSSAAFWLTAVAALPESAITLTNVGLNERRTAFLDILKRMGADIQTELQDSAPEPVGELRVCGVTLRGTRIGGKEIPSVIDELPLVAVAGALGQGITEIRDAQELRVKESDRIAAMAANLKLLGVKVEELPDGMRVHGGCSIPGKVKVKSYGDHRVAMAMAVLALFADAPVVIEDVDCVNASYPEFWQHLRHLGGVARVQNYSE